MIFSKKLELLKEISHKFHEERGWSEYLSPKNLSMSLSVEAGRLADRFRWLTEAESFEPDPDVYSAIKEEVGAIFLVLLNLSAKLKIDILEAANEKMKEIENRYPLEKVLASGKPSRIKPS